MDPQSPYQIVGEMQQRWLATQQYSLCKQTAPFCIELYATKRHTRGARRREQRRGETHSVLGDDNDGLVRPLSTQRQDEVLQASVPSHEDDVAPQALGQGGRVHPEGVGDAARDTCHLITDVRAG